MIHCFLCAGGTGIPLHWSLQAERRAVCFRLAPEAPNEAGPQWSHPIELDRGLSASARFVTLPVRPAAGARERPLMDLGEDDDGGQNRRGSYLRGVTTVLTAAAPEWELRGLQARVPRRVTHLSRCACSPGVCRQACESLAGWGPSMGPMIGRDGTIGVRRGREGCHTTLEPGVTRRLPVPFKHVLATHLFLHVAEV